jgi:hypothetical protein
LLFSLSISPRQQRFFTGWFLFAMFMAAGTLLGALGAGVRALIG